jgi:hypothetical protein
VLALPCEPFRGGNTTVREEALGRLPMHVAIGRDAQWHRMTITQNSTSLDDGPTGDSLEAMCCGSRLQSADCVCFWSRNDLARQLGGAYFTSRWRW